MAGSAKDVTSPLDDDVISLKDWITTLPCNLVDIPGHNLFIDHPDMDTNIYVHVADLDVTGAYPSGQIGLNMSRETTKIEVCSIEGVTEEIRRSAGRNMTAPKTNAIQISKDFFKTPSPSEMIAMWDEEHTVA